MNTRIYVVTMFFFSIFLFSCSSDPCEEVICVNGSCDEGICDCATGWKGPTCAEVDYNFIGEYRSSVIFLKGCPNSGDNGSRSADADNEVCSTTNGVTTCLSVLLRLEDDASFFLNIIFSQTDGTISTGDPTVTRGTYTISNNQVTLCDGQGTCSSMTLGMGQNVLAWDQIAPTSTACGVSWELTRQ